MTIAPFEFAVDFRHTACHAENCLCSFADAGQIRDTRTRVVKLTFARDNQIGNAQHSARNHHSTWKVVEPSSCSTWCSLIRSGSDVLREFRRL